MSTIRGCLIITDRIELDEQIEKIFKGVNEDIHRTTSGKDLVEKLNAAESWLICSLIHKFAGKEEGDITGYVEELQKTCRRISKPRAIFLSLWMSVTVRNRATCTKR